MEIKKTTIFTMVYQLFLIFEGDGKRRFRQYLQWKRNIPELCKSSQNEETAINNSKIDVFKISRSQTAINNSKNATPARQVQ